MVLACGDSPTSNDQIIGSGNVVTESRPVSDFDGVALGGVGQLIMEPGTSEALTITAEDNILPLLRSDVRDETLFLGPDPGTALSTTQDIVYRLTFRDMRSIAVSGVTVTTATGIETEVLSVVASGVTSIDLTGRADRQNLEISGTSSYLAENLQTRITSLTVSGSTRAVVRVSERLEGVVSGSADVEYIGSPQVSVTVSGSASVRPR
jgi:hypothetical protein